MMPTPMDQGLLKSSATKNAPKSVGTPQVKSSKTCNLFNAGVSGNSETAKSADPTCYDVVTVDQDRLFDNVEMKMERTVAIKKLGQLLGKKLGYRVDAKAPTKDERDAARTELVATLAQFEKLKERRDARYQAVLDADAEYQALKAACTKERDRRDRLSSVTRHYKITVGTSEGMFFMVRAEGDTWEEIFGKLTVKQAA